MTPEQEKFFKEKEVFKEKEARKVLGTRSRPAVNHYLQGGIEPIDFIMSHNLNFNLGNIIKYATRCDHKGSKEADLKKVIHYAQFELERMSKETDNG